MGNTDELSVRPLGPADIDAAFASMEKAEEAGIWSFEEGHYGHGTR